MYSNLSRRDFLKISALGFSTLAMRSWSRSLPAQDFPQSEHLGRVVVGKLDIMAQ